MTGAPIPSPLLRPGFADPVHDAQDCFREVLDAMAHPGRVVSVLAPAEAPPPLSIATAALLLTLADADTPIWLDALADTSELRAWLSFHCGAPIVSAPVDARFAVIADAASMPPLESFARGDDLYPDRSVTLFIQLGVLTNGPARRLRGPGIKTTTALRADGLPHGFAGWWASNHALYPLGVDVILTAGAALIALPRTVSLED